MVNQRVETVHRYLRGLGLGVLIGSALFALSCNSHSVLPFEENIVAEQTDKVGQVGSNKVDILWLVDNSGSMCEEQQQLKQNFNLFISTPVEIDVDFRLAVVTTDMMKPEESGRFQNIPDGTPGPACTVNVDISDCPTPDMGSSYPPLVIRSDDARYRDEAGNLDVATLQRDFGCNATVGTRGNGFEMGLEAAKTALSPALLGTGGHNAGFIRDDAFLAIIFLTDENDCSDRGALDKTNGNICEWEADKLVPESEYIDFFKTLKPTEDQIIMAGIIAPDPGIRHPYGEDVLPSCTSTLGEGYAGYRYENVIKAFAQNEVSNICSDNAFSSALESISRLIVAALDNKCLDAPPITCQSNNDCGPGATCEARGGNQSFCSTFRVQVEITRPMESGAIPDRECTPLQGSSPPALRCILQEETDYSLRYGDPNCPSSGISVELSYKLGGGDELGVRYPRAVSVGSSSGGGGGEATGEGGEGN